MSLIGQTREGIRASRCPRWAPATVVVDLVDHGLREIFPWASRSSIPTPNRRLQPVFTRTPALVSTRHHRSPSGFSEGRQIHGGGVVWRRYGRRAPVGAFCRRTAQSDRTEGTYRHHNDRDRGHADYGADRPDEAGPQEGLTRISLLAMERDACANGWKRPFETSASARPVRRRARWLARDRATSRRIAGERGNDTQEAELLCARRRLVASDGRSVACRTRLGPWRRQHGKRHVRHEDRDVQDALDRLSAGDGQGRRVLRGYSGRGQGDRCARPGR